MVLGIDLGTTFSLGAYVDEKDEPHVINNAEGSTTTPSVVLFDDEENIVVGEVAKENAVIRAEDVIAVVKNYMGKQKVMKKIGDTEYTPEMISSFIIRKVVTDAQQALNETIDGVVITVPAYFTDAQRKATKDAATMAGVNLLHMINEPTAAALCYAKKENVTNENIMVYDLGGGTFDVTILHIDQDGRIEVKSTGGLSNAGGRFFDQAIVDYVRDYFEDEHDIDLEDDEYEDELQDLYLKAENAKIQLTNKNSASIILKVGKIKEKIEITRELFSGMVKKTYRKTELKMQDALKEAGLTIAEIDKVLLVGGSSRIPCIEDAVRSFVGKEPSKEIHPDEAVALGAALYAKLSKEKQGSQQFVDVCSHSIGIVGIDEQSGEEINEIIIERNSQIPVEVTERFRTMQADQELIQLTVTEGEFRELSDVTVIGSFDVKLPKGVKERELILVKISLDGHQLIHIELELPDQNFSEEYKIRRSANMDEGKVEKLTGMLREKKVS